MGTRKSAYPNLIDERGEVTDLTQLDQVAMVPFAHLPKGLQGKLKGRPKASATKERITIRLSPDVVQSFRASGDGWQTRMDAALRDWLKTNKPA